MYDKHHYGIIILNQNSQIESYNHIALDLFKDIESHIGKRLLTYLETLENDYMTWHREKSEITINDVAYKVAVERFIGDPICNMVVTILPKSFVDPSTYYKTIIDTIPDAVVIVQDNTVKMANKAALSFIKQLEGHSIESFLRENATIASKRIAEVLETKSVGKPIDYTIYNKEGQVMIAEMMPAYIEFNNRPAILSIARDITIRKEELKEADRMQKMLLGQKLPNFKTLLMRILYTPSRTVSGDFYFFEPYGDNRIIGILGDMRGKGISAAMKISAFEVLFRESASKTDSFEEFLCRLNKKVVKYFDEYYVAGLIFLIDKEKQDFRIAGAGINEFTRIDHNHTIETVLLRGSFLGMFDQPNFDMIAFESKEYSRLLFYSDGFEEAILQDKEYLPLLSHGSIFDITHQLQKQLDNLKNSLKGLHDDATMLIMDLNHPGVGETYTFSGLKDYTYAIEPILEDINLPHLSFNIKLVIIELMTNAFKYGNQRDPELPIIVKYSYYNDNLVIEVSDTGLISKDFHIKDQIIDDDLMDESGRGLFIVEQLSESININGNTVVVEIKTGGMHV